MVFFNFFSRKSSQSKLSETDDDADDVSSPNVPAQADIRYPSGQLFVLGCCRLSEPVSMTSSSPYLYFMIRDFDVTADEKQIGRYVGFLASCYSFSQCLTGILWGRLSDSWGRKPIVLCGLFGTVSATLVFGFSRSYVQAMVARSIAGLLNGNVGVIRTMVAEMDVHKLHQARAFSVMPFVSNLGSILGPVLGGTLADPVNQYPSIFGNSKFLAKYPYALPNLVTASLLFLSFTFGFLFLAETHDVVKHKEDIGIKARRLVHRGVLWLRCRDGRHTYQKAGSRFSRAIESLAEDSDDYVPLSPTRVNLAAFSRVDAHSSTGHVQSPPSRQARPRFSDIFTKQVLLNMAVNAGINVQNNTFGQLFPLLCATKIEDGGLGMRPGQIGAALSVAGMMAVLFQMTVFPWCYNKLGGLFCMRLVLGIYPILYFCVPFLHHLLRSEDPRISPLVWAGIISVLSVRTLANVFTRPICAIFITQSCPSRTALGTVNGANQALAAFCRSIGPSVAGLVYSRSLEVGKPWIVWRLGLTVFAFIVWTAGWSLSDKNVLPSHTEYVAVEQDDIGLEGADNEELSESLEAGGSK